MSPRLTVHNAQVSTATVEIRTLTVSGKQVTLAVFRQLRDGPLISGDGTLSGVPWGTVNYHPDKRCSGTHMHVVWQLGGELRRTTVQPPDWTGTAFSHSAITGLGQAEFCASGHQWSDRTPRGFRNFEGMTCDFPHHATMCERLETECPDLDDARRSAAEAVSAERARRQRISGQWEALADLPQLFIAV